MASTQPTRALDRLKKAANLVPMRKVVELSDGSEFEFWHTNLTMAERERAVKSAGSSNPDGVAIQLLVTKCLDENGQRMFTAAEIPELKNEVRELDLSRIIAAMVQDDIDQGASLGK